MTGTRVYRRKRSRFASKRAAWADIARESNKRASQVVATAHTRTHYAWRVQR